VLHLLTAKPRVKLSSLLLCLSQKPSDLESFSVCESMNLSVSEEEMIVPNAENGTCRSLAAERPLVVKLQL
jgi:hypothetical protein